MVRKAAMVFGIIYTAVAVLGFLPFLGGTFGMDATNLLGFIPVNLLHNLVHLVIGLAGLAVASSDSNSKLYCQVVGVVLILVGLAGIVWSNFLGILPIGGIDIALHLLTGAILTYFGFAAPATRRATA